MKLFRHTLFFSTRLGHSPFYDFLLLVLTCTPVPLLFACEKFISTRIKFSDAGTVEAGAGAGGEGVKRKRSDDMAALEADLAPEPQAGTTQSPAPVGSPHFFQQSPLVSASPTSISSLCLYHSTSQAHQLHWWILVERCCLQNLQT